MELNGMMFMCYVGFHHVPNTPKVAALPVVAFSFFPILDNQGTISQFIQAL